MHVSRARALELAQPATVCPEVWARRLDRFPEPWRHRVRAVANAHPRLRDLAVSFPALLFALAAPRAGVDASAAKAAVVLGARLKAVAAIAHVPMWLRTFPPEAFAERLPPLPDSADFAKQVLNFVPQPRLAAQWLEAVGDAFDWADEPQALWIAREASRGHLPRRPRRRRPPGMRRVSRQEWSPFRRVCLWAWFTTNTPQSGPKWSPTMHLRGAETLASNWLADIAPYVAMGDLVIDNTWFEPMTVEGYDFVPLRSAHDLAEEGTAMQNCVRGYGHSLANNSSRIWSIRRDGVRQATLEVAFAQGDPLPSMVEIVALRNEAVSVELAFVARRWMALNERALTARPWQTAPMQGDRGWRAQWRPYWLAKRRIPDWLPLQPLQGGLWSIQRRSGDKAAQRRCESLRAWTGRGRVVALTSTHRRELRCLLAGSHAKSAPWF